MFDLGRGLEAIMKFSWSRFARSWITVEVEIWEEVTRAWKRTEDEGEWGSYDFKSIKICNTCLSVPLAGSTVRSSLTAACPQWLPSSSLKCQKKWVSQLPWGYCLCCVFLCCVVLSVLCVPVMCYWLCCVSVLCVTVCALCLCDVCYCVCCVFLCCVTVCAVCLCFVLMYVLRVCAVCCRLGCVFLCCVLLSVLCFTVCAACFSAVCF